QMGRPDVLYEQPINSFVANFIGVSNPIAGKVVEFDPATRKAVVDAAGGLRLRGNVTSPQATPTAGDAVVVAIRPERLRIDSAETAEPGPGWTAIEGHVRQGTYLGDQTEFRVVTGAAGELVVRRQNAAGANSGEGVGPGDRVTVSWHEEANLILFN
ncbi:MAG TPA: TOBE domain-containing protein, partial [Candidatus Limnocylindrales bacterium]|nr:TOBE domain-containing protein [Candidatus Limnocylindrales bacterium]